MNVVPNFSDSFHSELLCKVWKESFGQEHKQYYLKTYLDQCSLLYEAMISVLQQLLDDKIQLDEGKSLVICNVNFSLSFC